MWSKLNINIFHAVKMKLYTYVSESDILGPIDYLSDIENLVSFERAMFEDYSFKHLMNKPSDQHIPELYALQFYVKAVAVV